MGMKLTEQIEARIGSRGHFRDTPAEGRRAREIGGLRFRARARLSKTGGRPPSARQAVIANVLPVDEGDVEDELDEVEDEFDEFAASAA